MDTATQGAPSDEVGQSPTTDEPDQDRDASADAAQDSLPAGLLTAVLAALIAGSHEAARTALAEADGLAAGLREKLLAEVDDQRAPADIAVGLGDVLRSRGRNLDGDVVECYRAAFYMGADWQGMLANPLFARFQANKAGRPFDKWIHYFDVYAATLAPYVGKPVRVLEIGVFHGGGLDQLRDFLGPQATLVGADINPSARAACKGRFEVAIGDQTDPEFLASVARDYGPFDVIIDDGGHTVNQQITSIEHLFPAVNEGGVYIVEDTHTSYWDDYLDADVTFMEWAKARVDDLNAYHFSREKDLGVWTTGLSSIHFYDSVVVFNRARHIPPFCEIVGSGSFLFADRGMEIALLNYRASADLSHTYLAESQQLIGRIQARLDEADAVTAELRQETTALRAENRSLRRALSRSPVERAKGWYQQRSQRDM